MNLPDFFAIDIGNHSIKIVEVKREGKNKAKLLHLGKVDTPPGLLENESEEGLKALAEKISQLRESSGISTRKCVAAVPESAIFSRLVTVPKVEDDKLEQAVYWEVKPMIPVPLENVDIAFLDIGDKEVNGQKLVDVYVVAAPKTLTDKFRDIAAKAGLELLALETEALAITRSVIFSKDDIAGDVIIIDMGGSSTNIILSRNGVVVFSQLSSTGSDAFTKAIASDYGLDYAEAEKFKQSFGLNFDQGEGKIAKSIEPIMQILLTDINRTLSYFRERVGGKLSETVFLTGDGANLPGLGKYLTEKAGLTTEIVDVFKNLSMDNKVKSMASQITAAGMSVAIGLGLKDTES